MRLFLRLLVLLSITACFLILTVNVFAATEFTTSYNIEYTVDLKGDTTTRQQITLKNIYDNIYATQYSIIIGSTNISAVRASDNFGDINPEIKTESNSTKINLNFDKHIIGKDKARNVTISYKTPDFATVKGQVLEVGFPLLQNSEEMEDYQVTIFIPNTFGKATQIIPTPTSETKNNSFSGFVFSKSSLIKQDSITATFGTSQIYKFTLTYNLENPNTVRGRTELALPTDTNYQQILYKSLEPKPEQVNVDDDGNWLAQYVLDPNAKMSVKAVGNVRLSYFPLPEFASDLSPEQIQTYTQADEYWETNADNVASLAKQLQSPKQVYDYLINNFSYNYDRLNKSSQRLGAQHALQNPQQAICMEFTDAFIALARAAGIPAREINGYAYTENDRLRPLSLNQDILHAWPEYYDKTKKQWIQIDPTWGNTTGGLNFFDKFDLDHIAFVRHGVDSSYPVTAGSYKYTDKDTKDVEVSFDTSFQPASDFEIVDQLPTSGITGLPLQGFAMVKNTGTSAIYGIPLSVNLIHSGSVLKAFTQNISLLPPFGTYQLPISYTSKWQDKGGLYLAEIKSGQKDKTVRFELAPIINYQIILPVVGLLIFVLLLVIYRFKHRLSKKQKYYATHTR